MFLWTGHFLNVYFLWRHITRVISSSVLYRRSSLPEISRLEWVNMTIWCKHVHRLELQIFLNFVLRIHQLGHTNLFNCFTESLPKISENGKKIIEISKILFSRRQWFIYFKMKKNLKLFPSYFANAINSHYFCCKQNWHSAVSLTQLNVQPGADIRCEK